MVAPLEELHPFHAQDVETTIPEAALETHTSGTPPSKPSAIPSSSPSMETRHTAMIAKARTRSSDSKRCSVVSSGRRPSILGNFSNRHRAPHNYTSVEFERTLYDVEFHVGEDGMLMDDGIILTKGSPSPGLVRCLSFHAKVVDVLAVVSVYASTTVAPLTFIFDGGWNEPDKVPFGRTLLIVDLLLDIVYMLYLVWQLNVSYVDATRHCEVVCRRNVMLRSLRSPIYWIGWLSVTTYIWIFAGASQIFNCMKLVRLTHVINLPDSIVLADHAWEGTRLRVRRLFTLLLLWSHWTACLMANLGEYYETAQDREEHFYTFKGEVVNEEISLYVMAFVDAIYMITGALDNPLGDGTVREQKFGALVIVAVFGPLGVVAISWVLATLMHESELMSAIETKHERTQALMMKALDVMNIPGGLRRRVCSWHHFQRMGHDRVAFEALFSRKNLSPALSSALRIYLYHDNVLKCEYFKDRDTNYLLEIIRSLEDQLFLPGDYVSRRGEIGTCLYFIVRGEVCVLVPDPSTCQDGRKSIGRTVAVQTITAEEGGYFGEVALIKNCVRTAWVRADTYVLLAMLTRAKIEDIWRHFPGEEIALRKKAAQTARRDRARVSEVNLRQGRANSSDFADSSTGQSSPDRDIHFEARVLLGRSRPTVSFGFNEEDIVDSATKDPRTARSGASRALSEIAKMDEDSDDDTVGISSSDVLCLKDAKRVGDESSVVADQRDPEHSCVSSALREVSGLAIGSKGTETEFTKFPTQDSPTLRSGRSNTSIVELAITKWESCLRAAADAETGCMTPDMCRFGHEDLHDMQVTMIKNLAELVEGQSRMQGQVAELVQNLAGATVILSNDTPTGLS